MKALAILGLVIVIAQIPQLQIGQFQRPIQFSKDPGPEQPVNRYFYQLQQFGQQWQADNVILISDFHCFFLAKECQCQGLWLATLLPNQRFIDLQLGLNQNFLSSKEVSELGQALQQLQRLCPDQKLIIHADRQCKPWFIKCCQALISQGFLNLKSQQNGIVHYQINR